MYALLGCARVLLHLCVCGAADVGLCVWYVCVCVCVCACLCVCVCVSREKWCLSVVRLCVSHAWMGVCMGVSMCVSKLGEQNTFYSQRTEHILQ